MSFEEVEQLDEQQQEMLRIARSWIGTRFANQQGTKGVSVDCARFVEEVVCESGSVPQLPLAHDYQAAGESASAKMIEMLTAHTDFVGDTLDGARVGDIVALHDERDKTQPRHLAFLSQKRIDGVLYMVHAGEVGVTEHRLSLDIARRVHSVWRVKSKKNKAAPV